MNIFQGKFLNYEKFKTYQEGSTFIDYGLIHKEFIDEVDQVTYEPFGYRKGKGDHRGWYFDIRETALFGNQIDGVYQSKGRSLQSKDCKQLPDYLRAVDEFLTRRNVYNRIKKLMKSKRSHHKEAEAIDAEITEATQYGEQQCEIRHKDYWDFDVHTLKMKKNFWSYLIARRKKHLDTSVICTAAREEGIEMYNTSTTEALNILKQLQVDLKAHYRDHKTKRDEYLLSKANLAQDTGEEDRANAIRNIKKAEHRNQCYRNFRFHQGTGISAQEINQIQISKSWQTMQEYVEDAEFKWKDPKQVDKGDAYLWKVITVPEEIEFYLLKQNQLHVGQSEHESIPFITETMQQKFDWNTTTEEAEKFLKGTYDGSKDEELTEIMKLVLANCVQIAPPKINPEITVAQLRGKMKVWREGTTTSPSGHHLGHYKSLFTVIDKSLECMERKELKEI